MLFRSYQQKFKLGFSTRALRKSNIPVSPIIQIVGATENQHPFLAPTNYVAEVGRIPKLNKTAMCAQNVTTYSLCRCIPNRSTTYCTAFKAKEKHARKGGTARSPNYRNCANLRILEEIIDGACGGKTYLNGKRRNILDCFRGGGDGGVMQ